MTHEKEKVTLTIDSELAARLRHAATPEMNMPQIVERALLIWFGVRDAKPANRVQGWILRVFGMRPIWPAGGDQTEVG